MVPVDGSNSETNQMLVFWRIFSLLWKSLTREIFRTSAFPREIFRISLVVKLGLNAAQLPPHNGGRNMIG
jgi:hypothetical protein